MNQNKMELPVMKEDESENEFSDRCMDDPNMKVKFPVNEQRYEASRDLIYDRKTSALANELESMTKSVIEDVNTEEVVGNESNIDTTTSE